VTGKEKQLGHVDQPGGFRHPAHARNGVTPAVAQYVIPVAPERGISGHAHYQQSARLEGPAQLGEGRGRVMAGADVEKTGQRSRRGIGRVALGEVLEVPTPLRVGVRRDQRSGENDQCARAGARPSGHLLERFEKTTG